MRFLCVFILTCVLSLTAQARDYAPLDSLLQEFYISLLPEENEVKIREFDYLIMTCRDSLMRQHVALEVFDHYKESKLMGEEEVAVHIYDRWFKDTTIAMRGEFDLLDAELFAEFNRATLLGRDAPVLTMKDYRKRNVTFPEKGKCAILFFYDSSCAKCRLEMEKLPAVIGKITFPVNFYAVYCGNDKKKWAKSRRELKIKSKNVSTYHLWDPEIDTEYLKLYGVISTPRLYITEPQGTIMGRRLEAETLEEIIQIFSTVL